MKILSDIKSWAILALLSIVGVLSIKAKKQKARLRIEELKNAELKDDQKKQKLKEEVERLNDADLLAEYNKLLGEDRAGS